MLFSVGGDTRYGFEVVVPSVESFWRSSLQDLFHLRSGTQSYVSVYAVLKLRQFLIEKIFQFFFLVCKIYKLLKIR